MLRPLTLPEIGLDHPRILAHFVGMPLGDFLAVIQNVYPMRDSHHHAHIVLDEKNRLDIGADEPFEKIHQRIGLAGIHPRRRLVEQQ